MKPSPEFNPMSRPKGKKLIYRKTIFKNKKKAWPGDVALAVELLPSKNKAQY
jgi:hypothetical protein